MGDSFDQLFHTHREAVFRFLWRLSRNAADAEDLLQETFLTAWRKRDQFDGRGSVSGWLRKTAFRTYLNEREKRERRRRLVAESGPPDRGSSSQVAPSADTDVARADAQAFLKARVEEALAALPHNARESFVLFRYESMTCAEIGVLIGAPAKTVETRVRRATEQLARRLERYRKDLFNQ